MPSRPVGPVDKILFAYARVYKSPLPSSRCVPMNVSTQMNSDPTMLPFDKARVLIDTTLEQCRGLTNSLYKQPDTMVVVNKGDVWTVAYKNRGSVIEYQLVDGPSTPMCIMRKVEGVSQPIPTGEEEVLFMGVFLTGTDSEVMNRVAMAHALHYHHHFLPASL